jgi:muramoyltetrapeptide carboxypeptidase
MSGVLKKPRALRPGDRLALVSPASGFDRAEFDAGVEELRALGFEPTWDQSIFERGAFVAGPAGTRADAIDSAWQDPGIAGLVGVRGGYGSVQVLPLLDAAVFRRTPKIFIGYSDVTSVLTWLTQTVGCVAFHGPMVAGRLSHGSTRYDEATLLGAVTRTEPLGRLAPTSLEVLQPGESTGLLTGGTLTQLVASLGTPFGFDPPPGCVLFLDEVNERPYRLDRMLVQLLLSGLVGRASAIVFNELPNCDEPEGGAFAIDTIRDVLKGFDGPIVRGFPSGHTPGAAITLPFGVRVTVSARRAPALVVEDAAVA